MTTQQAFELALDHHRSGRAADAEAIYRQVLASEPRHADALHLLGVLAHQAGRNEAAVRLIRQAIAAAPSVADYHSNLGGIYRAMGQFDEAIAAYRRAVALRPDFPEAHSNLGIVLRRKGQLDEAIAAHRHAIALKPGYAEAHYNLGNALKEKGERDEAIVAYRLALQFKPDFAPAGTNLGLALKAKGQLEDAVAAFRAALRGKPVCTDTLTYLGNTLNDQGRVGEAIAVYRRALELKPDSPGLQHVLAALTGDDRPTTAPASYVRELFDGYADQFDDHLLGQLHYRVPALLREAIVAVAPGRRFDILDLGCGTGLCGVQFRSLAKSLTGVDLAPGMIAKAAARGIYDRLITGEVVETLREHEGSFDLILAGDVFGYVGDLSRVFPAAARSLRVGGLFAFSLEKHDGEGFVLHSRVRFAHSLAYLRDRSREQRFAELHMQEATLRKEVASEVAGWIVVLQKPEVSSI